MKDEYISGVFYLVVYFPELSIKTQSVRRSKHSIPLLYKTSQLMPCTEIIAVCSQIHTKHTNTLCGQNVELLEC